MTISEIKTINEEGIEKLREVIWNKEINNQLNQWPQKILDKYSEPTQQKITVKIAPKPEITTPLSFAHYLNEIIPFTTENYLAIQQEERGIGTWLFLVFFEIIAKNGHLPYSPHNRMSMYVPSRKKGGKYRHLVLGKWLLYGIHKQEATIYFSNNLHENPEILKTLCLEQDLMESTIVCKIAEQLFAPGEFLDKIGYFNHIGKKEAYKNFRAYMEMLRSTWNFYEIQQDMFTNNLPLKLWFLDEVNAKKREQAQRKEG